MNFEETFLGENTFSHKCCNIWLLYNSTYWNNKILQDFNYVNLQIKLISGSVKLFFPQKFANDLLT